MPIEIDALHCNFHVDGVCMSKASSRHDELPFVNIVGFEIGVEIEYITFHGLLTFKFLKLN